MSSRTIYFVAALVLLFAAAMKFEQLPVVDRMGEGLLHRPAFVIGLIVFEIVLAAWLLFGVWPRWTKWIPAICFSLFAMAALYLAITGAESCGCFGRVKVNPWVTFAMDVVLAGALWRWPPGKGREAAGTGRDDRGERKTRGLAYRIIAAGGAAAIALTLSLRQLPVVATQASGESGAIGMIEAGGLTILEPREWIGHALPILPHLDIAERLKTGQWLAVLYHADCSTCRKAVPGYERMAGSHPVALLEMPPFAHGVDERLVPADSPALVGRLTDAREWFATTPVVLLLNDAVVRDVTEGPAAVGAAVDWTGMKLTPR